MINQIYSNADGTVQFVIIEDTGQIDCDAEENMWAGAVLTSSGPGPFKAFAFPTDLPTCHTSGRDVLIATEGFAALGLIPPDFVIPNNFLQIPSGTVALGASLVTYTGLPN
ncbi:MAG TPA: calcium-binding protein, partial [Casimicrobiaceae bacterium]|nr:calcium-binding protein [Casimicrobiaceae bacterium]